VRRCSSRRRSRAHACLAATARRRERWDVRRSRVLPSRLALTGGSGCHSNRQSPICWASRSKSCCPACLRSAQWWSPTCGCCHVLGARHGEGLRPPPDESPGMLLPPQRTARTSSRSRARRIAVETSSAVVGRTISAGRSIMPFPDHAGLVVAGLARPQDLAGEVVGELPMSHPVFISMVRWTTPRRRNHRSSMNIEAAPGHHRLTAPEEEESGCRK
jgi:hypothetical protein